MTLVNKAMFPLNNSIRNITNMKTVFDKLQLQLATGEKASTLAEMGSDRYFDLGLRQRIARIDAYESNITTVGIRLSTLDTTLSRIDEIEADARAAAVSGIGGSEKVNLATFPTLAASRLDEVLSLLNTDVNGRYLFGGSSSEAPPVASGDAVLNGANGKAGLKQLVSERRLADLGTGNMGRLAVTSATDTVTLAEDGVHPFGLKLSTIVSSTSAITAVQPSGSPPELSVQFGATLPTAGDTVSISVVLPDGTEEQIVLAASNDPSAPGTFQIGADADATAASFATALSASIQAFATTDLATASAFAASDDFFFGQGESAMRVDGPPFETATAQLAGTSADTVLWYTGEDSGNPRQTVTAKVGEGTSVAYGVQANEGGLARLVRTLGAVAAQSFPDGDATSEARFTAMASRNASRLAENNNDSSSIAAITVELGLASASAGQVAERHTAYKAQLTNMLDEIETAVPEEVAMQILALKTRLEASYQTTSMLSQLSLVNYI